MDINLSKKDAIDSKLVPYRIGILPVAGFALMSYACTVEPLRAANLLSGKPLYHLCHFTGTEGVPSSSGATIAQDQPIGSDVPLDLLLVIAGGDPFAFQDKAVFEWLRKLDRRGVQIGGVSGGSVILAQAGLMQGRRMTTHWEHAPALIERFPEILIERRLYVMDRNRMTCGGGTAPLDMMHALIAAAHGGTFAHLISDWFLHTDIRGAAAPQRRELRERIGVYSPHLLNAVSAMEDHIADPLTLPQLALVAGVSSRHLNRLFQQAFSQPAMMYYRILRLNSAQRLVQHSTLSITDIAEIVGFTTVAHFSTAYRKLFGVNPHSARKI